MTDKLANTLDRTGLKQITFSPPIKSQSNPHSWPHYIQSVHKSGDRWYVVYDRANDHTVAELETSGAMIINSVWQRIRTMKHETA